MSSKVFKFKILIQTDLMGDEYGNYLADASMDEARKAVTKAVNDSLHDFIGESVQVDLEYLSERNFTGLEGDPVEMQRHNDFRDEEFVIDLPEREGA